MSSSSNRFPSLAGQPSQQGNAVARYEVLAGSGDLPATRWPHRDLPPPTLPLDLSAPVGLRLYGVDAITVDPDVRTWWEKLGKRPRTRRPLIERVGWALRERDPQAHEIEEVLAVSFADSLCFVTEWDALETQGVISNEEWQNQAPSVLQRAVSMGADARTVFAKLVEIRRDAANTSATLLLESVPVEDYEDSGFTLVHVATGISASFFSRDGVGGVLAKSYSNPFRPSVLADQTQDHFLGYGVGRRLYLAAHALWPQVRWEDGALRDTSHALRRALHRIDPHVWEDKKCSHCAYRWLRLPRQELLKLHAQL